MAIKVVVLLLMVVTCVYTYPSGAPSNICGRYVPGHRNMGTPVGNGPQTGPFMLTATQSGSGQYTVSLRSTTAVSFKGFVIMAVQSWKQLPDGAADIVGIFQPDFGGQSQIRSCNTPSGSNTVTHTSSEGKTSVEVNWRAPVNLPDPSVKFVATVVRDYDNFYVVHSAPVQVTDDFGTPTASVPGNTASSFNNFQGVQPTDSGLSAILPAVDTTGATRRNDVIGDVIGGGLSVISNDLFSPTSAPVNTPDFSLSFSVTDAPPPPIILPDGRVSSHVSSGAANTLLTSDSSTLASSLSSSVNSSLPSSAFSITVNQTLPLPSSDPLSLLNQSEPPSFISLISGGNSQTFDTNSRRQQSANSSPSFSNNNMPFVQSFTPSPTQAFSTVTFRTFGSVQRPVMPTMPVTSVNLGNRASESSSTSSVSSSQSIADPARSSSSSNAFSTTPVRSSSQSNVATILIPINTQNDSTIFEPINFADIRAPTPTVSVAPEGIPVDLPAEAIADVINVSSPPVNFTSTMTGGPQIQFINLPILPEGQRAAVLDIVDRRQPEPSVIVDKLTGSRRTGPRRNTRPNGGMTQGQGQGQFGQSQSNQFNQGLSQGGQFGNRFGQQMNFGRQPSGMQGGRSPFGQQFRQGQGQMFGLQGGRQGQFGGRGGMPTQFGGLNLPTFTGNQLQGQGGLGGQQPGQDQNQLNGQQNGQQPGSPGNMGNQISSSNLFGGQFGTPNNQQGQNTFGQFGQTGSFGQGQTFQGRGNPFQNNPFAPPGFNAGGRVQFNGFGGQQRQRGQFGGFGQQFGNQNRFGGQGRFGRQGGQFGNQNFGSQLFNRGGMNRNPMNPQFGGNPFGQNQGQGGNTLNTFANVPAFGAGQAFGSQNTQTLGGQQGMNGQSSGSLFGQLSPPNGNTLNDMNSGNGQMNTGNSLMNTGNGLMNTGNGLTNTGNGLMNTGNGQNGGQPSTNNQNTGNSGGLSSFSFGPFTPNTK